MRADRATGRSWCPLLITLFLSLLQSPAVAAIRVRVRPHSLAPSQSQALCGPCWSADRNTVPVVLLNTTEYGPIIDPLTCNCPTCRPSTLDLRPCAVAEYPACTTVDGSFFSATRLCGPLALGCSYSCSMSSSTLAPVCTAVPGTCECTHGVPDKSRCLSAPALCTTATRIEACGRFAANCTVQTGGANGPIYNCTGHPGALPSSPNRFDVPPGPTATLAVPLPPVYDSTAQATPLPLLFPLLGMRDLAAFNCSWTAADVRARTLVGAQGYSLAGYLDQPTWTFPNFTAWCAAAGVVSGGFLLLDPALTALSVWDDALGTRNVSRVNGISAATDPITDALLNTAAFVPLADFVPGGQTVGLDKTLAGALVLNSSVAVLNALYGLYASTGDALPSVTDYRADLRVPTRAEQELVFQLEGAVPNGHYTLYYDHWLRLGTAGASPAAAGYRQSYTVSVRLVAGGRVASELARRTVTITPPGDAALTNSTSRDWMPSPSPGLSFAVPTSVSAPVLQVAFVRTPVPEEDVLRCEEETALQPLTVRILCRLATGVDANAFRCVRAAAPAALSDAAVLATCGLASLDGDATPAYRQLRRANGTDLLLVRNVALVPSWTRDARAPLRGVWHVPQVVARLDFADGLTLRTDAPTSGDPAAIPRVFVEARYGSESAFDAAYDDTRNGLVLRFNALYTGLAWISLALPPATATSSVSVHRAYTKMAWVSMGGLFVDPTAPSASFINILSDPTGTDPLALNEVFAVYGGRLHCGTARGPKFNALPSMAYLQSAALPVNASFLSQWHHVACTASSTPPDPATWMTTTTYTLVVDGVLVATQTARTASRDRGLGTTYLGAYALSIVTAPAPANQEAFRLFDNVGIYDRALTLDVIAAIVRARDPDGDTGTPTNPTARVCRDDGECSAPIPALSTRAFPVTVGFPLAVDELGTRWSPLPDTEPGTAASSQYPAFADELRAAYNWSAREAQQYVAIGAEFGILDCLYRHLAPDVSADAQRNATTCAVDTATAYAGTYAGTNASQAAFALLADAVAAAVNGTVTPPPGAGPAIGVAHDLRDGVTERFSVVYSTTASAAGAAVPVPVLVPDLSFVVHPVVCTRPSQLACGAVAASTPVPRSATGNLRLVSATASTPPFVQRVGNVTNGVCFTVPVPSVDARSLRMGTGPNGTAPTTAFATGYARISVQCTASLTGARFVVRSDCTASTNASDLNTTVIDSAVTEAMRSDTTPPRFALRHGVYVNPCTDAAAANGTCTRYAWANGTEATFTTLISVDCGAALPLPSFVLPCTRAETEAACGESATACLRSCVYSEGEARALPTSPFVCTVIPASCACPNYDAVSVDNWGRPCRADPAVTCSASEYAAFGCDTGNLTACRKLCTATGCSVVPATCYANFGVAIAAACTPAEADAACGPEFSAPSTSAPVADATLWYGVEAPLLLPGDEVASSSSTANLGTTTVRLNQTLADAFWGGRTRIFTHRGTNGALHYRTRRFAFGLPLRPDFHMALRDNACLYVANDLVYENDERTYAPLVTSPPAPAFTMATYEAAAALCDATPTCIGLAGNAAAALTANAAASPVAANAGSIWLVAGRTVNSSTVTNVFFSRAHCSRCVAQRTRVGRNEYVTNSTTCTCPRAHPDQLSPAVNRTAPPAWSVGYAGATNTPAGRSTCACQLPYGLPTPPTGAGACASYCVPCTTEETAFHCTPGAATALSPPPASVPQYANDPIGAIQTTDVCTRCPFAAGAGGTATGVAGYRPASCPGTYTLRSCNASEVRSYCGAAPTYSGCLLSCDTSRAASSRCRLWGRCSTVRPCTAAEVPRLCGRYDPAGIANVRTGFYARNPTGPAALVLPAGTGAVHPASESAATSCSVLEEQVTGGLRVTARNCTYSCPFIDARYGICTPFNLTGATGACAADVTLSHCGFPDQVTSCGVDVLGHVTCVCADGWGPNARGKCRGMLRSVSTATGVPGTGYADLMTWVGAFAENATLSCEGGAPRTETDPLVAGLPEPPRPDYHVDLESHVLGDRSRALTANVSITVLGGIWHDAVGADSASVPVNTTAAALVSDLRRGGRQLLVPPAVGVGRLVTRLSLPPLPGTDFFTIAFWVRVDAALSTDTVFGTHPFQQNPLSISLVPDALAPATHYRLRASLFNGLVSVTEPSDGATRARNTWTHVALTYGIDGVGPRRILSLYRNGTRVALSESNSSVEGATPGGDVPRAIYVRCMGYTALPAALAAPGAAVVINSTTNLTVAQCAAACLHANVTDAIARPVTQMWHSITVCACDLAGLAMALPTNRFDGTGCTSTDDDGQSTGAAGAEFAIFDIYRPRALAGRLWFGSTTPTAQAATFQGAFDDVRIYNTELNAAAVARIYHADRFLSASANCCPTERCEVRQYACGIDGFFDGSTGLVCGTNAARVLIDRSATGGSSASPSSGIRVLRRPGLWSDYHETLAAHHGRGSPALEAVIVRINASEAALEVLEAVCGARATQAEVDIPVNNQGALIYSDRRPRGVKCTCEAGWFTELQSIGVTTSDPLGTGPCVNEFQGRPCTAAESATMPWEQLQRDCAGGFRCWKTCVNADCTQTRIMSQPPCTDTRIPDATCTPKSAAARCPQPVYNTNASLYRQVTFSCRGACVYNSAIDPMDGASMQDCPEGSVYQCEADLPTGLSAVRDSTASAGASLQYTIRDCRADEPRTFCGNGATGCKVRVSSATLEAYRYETCTCTTGGTTATYSVPCGGIARNMAAVIERCGRFALNADRVECSATTQGGCSDPVCDCMNGTGRAFHRPDGSPVVAGSPGTQCAAYIKPCDGPADATRRCQAHPSVGRSHVYEACRLHCLPNPRPCTNASGPCWDRDCSLDPDSCKRSGEATVTVPLIGPGGIPYEAPYTDAMDPVTVQLRQVSTCPIAEVCSASNSSDYAEQCASFMSPCQRACRMGSILSLMGVPRADVTVPGTPYQCYELCSPKAQLCDISYRPTPRLDPTCASVSVPRKCSNGRNTTYTETMANLVCTDPAHWIADTENGGALRCSCASGCMGCVSATNDTACPSFPYTLTGTATCRAFCPAAATTCVVERVPTAAFDAVCGTTDSCAQGCGPCATPSVGVNATCGPNSDAVRLAALFEANLTMAQYYARMEELCTRFRGAARAAAATPLPPKVACGDSQLLSVAPDLETGKLRVGSIVYHLRTPCTPEQARTFCGQAADSCFAVDGVVALSTCRCRAAEDVQSFVGRENTSPVNNEACVGDGSERVCTTEESERYCGVAGTVGCAMVAKRTTAQSAAVYNTWLNREPDTDCVASSVLPSALGVLGLMRTLLERLPYRRNRTEGLCIPRTGGMTDDILMNSYYPGTDTTVAQIPDPTPAPTPAPSASPSARPTATPTVSQQPTGAPTRVPTAVPTSTPTAAPATATVPAPPTYAINAPDTAGQLLAAVLDTQEINNNWAYFGALHTKVVNTTPGAAVWFVDAVNPRDTIGHVRVVYDTTSAAEVASRATARCDADPDCGGWGVNSSVPGVFVVHFYERPIVACPEPLCTAYFARSTTGMRAMAPYGFKREHSMEAVPRGIEGPLLLTPFQTAQSLRNLTSRMPGNASGVLLARGLTEFAGWFRAAIDGEHYPFPAFETSFLSLQRAELEMLCLSMGDCCGVSYLENEQLLWLPWVGTRPGSSAALPYSLNITGIAPDVVAAPALIGYPCRATYRLPSLAANMDRFRKVSLENWPNECTRHGFSITARRTFMLKTRLLNGRRWTASDLDRAMATDAAPNKVFTTETVDTRTCPSGGSVTTTPTLRQSRVRVSRVQSNVTASTAVAGCGQFATTTYELGFGHRAFGITNPGGLAAFMESYLAGNMLSLMGTLSNDATGESNAAGGPIGLTVRDHVANWYLRARGLPHPFYTCVERATTPPVANPTALTFVLQPKCTCQTTDDHRPGSPVSPATYATSDSTSGRTLAEVASAVRCDARQIRRQAETGLSCPASDRGRVCSGVTTCEAGAGPPSTPDTSCTNNVRRAAQAALDTVARSPATYSSWRTFSQYAMHNRVNATPHSAIPAFMLPLEWAHHTFTKDVGNAQGVFYTYTGINPQSGHGERTRELLRQAIDLIHLAPAVVSGTGSTGPFGLPNGTHVFIPTRLFTTPATGTCSFSKIPFGTAGKSGIVSGHIAPLGVYDSSSEYRYIYGNYTGALIELPSSPNVFLSVNLTTTCGPFACILGAGTGINGTGRCSATQTPIRYKTNIGMTYGLQRWFYEIAWAQQFPHNGYCLGAGHVFRTHLAGNFTAFRAIPANEWHLFYKYLPTPIVPHNGDPNNYYPENYTGLPNWSPVLGDTDPLGNWYNGGAAYTGDAVNGDAACQTAKAASYSTSVFAQGGARASENPSCQPHFRCAACPVGRTGAACQTLAIAGTSWAAGRDVREMTYGIAHYGTACQSRRSTASTDTPLSTDCGDEDVSGRRGCINGVYNWQTARCDCDRGWTTPNRSSLAIRTREFWRASIYYANLFPSCRKVGDECADGMRDTGEADTANPLYMCIVPTEDETNYTCTDRAGFNSADCRDHDIKCQPCNGRGTCVDGRGCICKEGFYGRYCDKEIASLCAVGSQTSGFPDLPLPLNTTLLPCSGHGVCTVANVTCNCDVPGVVDDSCCTVTAQCTCVGERGYGWARLNCSQPYVQSINDVLGGGCLNNGTLRADAPPSSSTPVTSAVGHRVWCQCPVGWTGLRCELSACPVGPTGLPCNGHGVCTTGDNGEPTCLGNFSCAPNCVYNAAEDYTYANFTGRRMCIEPGGFTAEHPPLRWRGAACEIDTHATCSTRVTANNGTSWYTCQPIGGTALPRNTTRDLNGCLEDPNVPGAYRCKCEAFQTVNVGLTCERNPCRNPNGGAPGSCSGFNDRCITVNNNTVSFCNCKNKNPVAPKFEVNRDVPQLRFGDYCETDFAACGAMYTSALGGTGAPCLATQQPSGEWTCRGTITGDTTFGFYTCHRPGLVNPNTSLPYMGECRERPDGSGGLACFCAGSTTRCTDNTCFSCVAPPGSITDEPTRAPTAMPTIAVPPNATASPTRMPTTAPTIASAFSISYALPTNDTRCGGTAVAGRYCVTIGGNATVSASFTVVRGGTLSNATATFAATPSIMPAGLFFNTSTGQITGQPNASGNFTIAVRATTSTMNATTTVTLTVTARCVNACSGDNVAGCNGTTGTAVGTCLCRGIWFTTNASQPCREHACVGDAYPDSETAAACRCADARMSPDVGCASDGCPASPTTGQSCGDTIQTSLAIAHGGADPAKECRDRQCVCAWPYRRNNSTGLCDALCDVSATLSTFNGICTCYNTLPPRSPESGCRDPLCFHGAAFDETTSRCLCQAPFTGFSCPITGAVASASARCQCHHCVYGRLSCAVDPHAAVCSNDNVTTPTCTCGARASGTRCERTSCDGDRGGVPAADGETCVCNSPVWGGPNCTTSQCANGGVPRYDIATTSWKCACPDGYAAGDTLCTGACAFNARPNAVTGACECLPLRAGPTCATDLCVHGDAEGRFGVRASLTVPGTCDCGSTGFWRGPYCNISYCGALGTPIAGAGGLRSPDGCTCNDVAEFVPTAASNTSRWACRHKTNCNGAGQDPATGACLCGPGNPLCAPTQTVPGGNLSVGVPTASPTRAPTQTPTASSATSAPTPAPTTGTPTPGGVGCVVCPEDPSRCCGTTGGSTPPGGTAPPPDIPGSNTTIPGEDIVDEIPTVVTSSATHARAAAITWLLVLLPVLFDLFHADD